MSQSLDWEYSKYQMRYDNAGNLLKVDVINSAIFLCFRLMLEVRASCGNINTTTTGHITFLCAFSAASSPIEDT